MRCYGILVIIYYYYSLPTSFYTHFCVHIYIYIYIVSKQTKEKPFAHVLVRCPVTQLMDSFILPTQNERTGLGPESRVCPK